MNTTTRLLIRGDDAYILASDLSEFASELTYFAVYCRANLGSTKSDYRDAFKRLKGSWDSLLATRDIPNGILSPVTELFGDIEKLLKSREISDKQLMEIHNSIFDFLDDHIVTESPDSFKHRFLEHAISGSAKRYYYEGLFDGVSSLIENEEYDAAVLVAFKYLDSNLRKLTGITSHEVYGEELINKVFSLSSGILQINTHPNEQNGLRNWFSGANALFRNPVAHRFQNFSEDYAISIISMIDLMTKISQELSEKNKDVKASGE